MKLNVVSYGGTVINDGVIYASKIIEMPPLAEVSGIDVMRNEAAPEWGGKVIKGGNFDLQIDFKGTAAAQIESLMTVFNIERQELQSFVIEDTNNANKQWQINAAVMRFSKWDNNIALFKMYAPDPIWKSVTQYGGTISAAGTTDASGTVTVTGNMDAYPTITITTTSYPAGGYGYRRYVLFYNNSTKELVNYPVNLSGTLGTWDTATLVSGGKMQADGADIRLLVNGNEYPFWLNGMNSSTTTIWTTFNSQPAIKFLTAVSISNTGTPAFIDVKNTTTDKKAAALFPTAGIILIGDEEFTYEGYDAVKRKFTVTGRSVRNTAAASHGAGSTARLIENDICIMYGNATAEAQEVDATQQPIIDLTQSSNATHVYQEFADLEGKRAGSWAGIITKSSGGLSYLYTGNQGTVGTDPASAMGIWGAAWQYGTTWKAEALVADWRLYVPCRGTSVTSTGYKYLYTTTSGFPKPQLRSSANNSSFAVEWTEAKPSTSDSWVAWTHNNEAIAAGKYYLQYYFAGSVSGIQDATAAFEVSTVSISFDQSLTPYVDVRAEEQNYWMDLTLNNTTTGDGITIEYPVAVGIPMVIDTDARTVTYNGVNALGAVQRDSIRAEIFKLQTGPNAITYETAAGGTIEIVFSWYDRQNI